MEWLKRFFKPRQNNFVELMVKQGEYAILSVEALQAYLKKQSNKKTTQARQVEKEADEIQRILIHELEDTFVTPIDREDIFALSRALDNFIDYVYDTVEELEIFQLAPSDDLTQISDLILEMAQELQLAVKNLIIYPRVANDHARRVKGLENQVENTYRHAIFALFQGPEDVQQIMDMLKMREVLRHISNAADQGDMAADVILDISMKWS